MGLYVSSIQLSFKVVFIISEGYQNTIQHIVFEKNELETNLNYLEKQYKQNLEELSTLNDSKEKQFIYDEKMIENYEEQINTASKKIEKYESEITVLTRKLENLTSTNDKLQTLLENTQNEREILLTFLDKNNLEKKSFRETLDQHRTAGFTNMHGDRLKQEIKELKKSNVEVVLKNKHLKDQINELSKTIATKPSEIFFDKNAVILKNFKNLERENNNLLKTIELLKLKNTNTTHCSKIQLKSSLHENKQLEQDNRKLTEKKLNDFDEKYNVELKK